MIFSVILHMYLYSCAESCKTCGPLWLFGSWVVGSHQRLFVWRRLRWSQHFKLSIYCPPILYASSQRTIEHHPFFCKMGDKWLHKRGWEGELLWHLPGEMSFRKEYIWKSIIQKLFSLKLVKPQFPLGCLQVTLEIKGVKYHKPQFEYPWYRRKSFIIEAKRPGLLAQFLLQATSVIVASHFPALEDWISNLQNLPFMDVWIHFITLVMNWTSVLQTLDGALRVNVISPVPSKTSQSSSSAYGSW